MPHGTDERHPRVRRRAQAPVYRRNDSRTAGDLFRTARADIYAFAADGPKIACDYARRPCDAARPANGVRHRLQPALFPWCAGCLPGHRRRHAVAECRRGLLGIARGPRLLVAAGAQGFCDGAKVVAAGCSASQTDVSSRASEARPGTHNHRVELCHPVSALVPNRWDNAVWVPAFAGTTALFYFDGSRIET